MNAYTKIRAALEMATGGRPSNIAAAQEALAALAELERAAAEPVAWRYEFENRADRWDLEFFPGNHMPYTNHVRNITPLYAAPPAPVAEIREAVVTRPMCHGAWARFWSEPNNGDSCDQALRWLEAWRSELGPALGLVEIREPTPEECERIYRHWEQRATGLCRTGRDAFDAVRAVMWPKEWL